MFVLLSVIENLRISGPNRPAGRPITIGLKGQGIPIWLLKISIPMQNNEFVPDMKADMEQENLH